MAIYMSRLGTYGRLANQLLEFLSLTGMARRLNTNAIFPKVGWFEHLENPPETVSDIKVDRLVKEEYFHYTPEIFKGAYKEVVDFEGCFQSPKYWDNDKEFARRTLKFKQSFIDSVIKKVGNKYGSVIMHVRRGDYVGHKGYKYLTPAYYEQAVEKYFKGRNILLFTDDYDYCRSAFDIELDYSAEGLSPIESICAMIEFGDGYIVANSTFSWISAYLGNGPVIRPKDYFMGKKAKICNTKDFWPEDWTIFEPTKTKYDLKDTTFIIPVSFDSKDRRQNLELITYFLLHNFETNIIIGEQGSGEYFKYMEKYAKYIYFDYRKFHRTKMLNEMTKMAETPYVVNYDADVLTPPKQLAETINRLRNGDEFVYPYDGRFIRLDRNHWFNILAKDIDMVDGFANRVRYATTTAQVSVGGAVAFNKEAYMGIKGENPNFISFGREDYERILRARRMGLKVSRVKGCLYHADHWVGENSSVKHPNMRGNKEEYRKVAAMTKEELTEYIKTWG